MTALVESGRAKQDAELSCSSFSNQEPPSAQQHHQQQQQTQSSEKKQHHQADLSADNWSTKLSSVPLSIGFDLSVFATHDRCGRLTLHPVLRAVDKPKVQGDSQNLGRNNCARTVPDYRAETSESPDCNRAASSRRKPQLILDAADICTESRADSISESPVPANAKITGVELPARSNAQVSKATDLNKDNNNRDAVTGCSWSKLGVGRTGKSSRVHKDSHSNFSNKPSIGVDSHHELRRQSQYSNTSKLRKDIRRPRASEHRSGQSSSDLPPGSLAMVVQNLEALLSALDPCRSRLERAAADSRSSASLVSSTTAGKSAASLSNNSAFQMNRPIAQSSQADQPQTRELMSVSDLQLEYETDRSRRLKSNRRR
ncbi:hypothetical protein BOX15_Mlig028758g1 [Macrostomum lignano]|uniref:Uncharacterized protein n=2 Tax=Macrostomum lignano TaxID=282301 RepID=A0A267DEV7_9PLAT|nr:hypothetical protein BOX15_Mlig028758g1 [Macrostomum lignano]